MVDLSEITKDDHKLVNYLYKKSMTGEWKAVVEIYRKHTKKAHTTMINNSGDTALHVAVSIAPEDVVEELVRIIINYFLSGLKNANKKGNTLLHVAASMGKLSICILIAKADKSLGHVRNNNGESPLFLAVFHAYKDIFLCLHFICTMSSNEANPSYNPSFRRNDGETILHCAIRWEYFDLAYQILKLDNSLAHSVNEQGITPLHLLASKPSAFKSGCHLGWWKNIIYHCINIDDQIKETDPKQLLKTIEDKKNQNFPENYRTCMNFFQLLRNVAQAGGKVVHKKSRRADEESPSRPDVTRESTQEGTQAGSEAPKRQFFRRCSAISFAIFNLLYTILILVVLGCEDTRKIRQKHKFSVQIMQELIKSTSVDQYLLDGTNPRLTTTLDDREPPTLPMHDTTASDSTANSAPSETKQQDKNESTKTCPKKKKKRGKRKTLEMARRESPILIASRNGITEMVKQLLKAFPMAINDMSAGKNIVLLAAENRQPRILQLLLHLPFPDVKGTLLFQTDKKGNNALHLAAQLGKRKPWLIPGAALQMQWEIRWYEFVKNNTPQYFRHQLNSRGNTPEEIFTKSHEDLVDKGGKWLKNTANSCSVVAALIATVAFTTSTTIPGDLNKQSGVPNLESHRPLTIFAIASLVALCFSITALFLFLAILTSRYQHRDFQTNLPRKLLFGLTSLFVSIASMLVSFCAGHFFTLQKKLKDKAFPVYAVACLPIILFAIAQFPLYFDLLRANYRKVPRPSYKVDDSL